MPKISPLYLDPVVGYFMWYLSAPRGRPPHKYTDQEALERAMSNDDFAGITPEEFNAAMAWAKRNLAAAENAAALPESSYIKSGFVSTGNAKTVRPKGVFSPHGSGQRATNVATVKQSVWYANPPAMTFQYIA